jgi:shikimate dehydrogenase
MTKQVGLIGYPLGHSVSPLFQQAAFDYLGLDIRYELWETERAQLPAVVAGLRQPSKLGANVTVPYKKAVLPLLDELDELAASIGAANVIVNREGKLIGYNTDAEGFMKALRQDGGFEPEGKRIVLLGAGGVARAAGFALVKAKARSLVISNWPPEWEWALALASDLQSFGSEIVALPWDSERLSEALDACDLVVNCTSVGMKHSATEGQSPLSAKLIPRQALIYDVVYNPIETPLLADAKKVGARTLSGLQMLVYQGAAAFELWTRTEAPVDIMFKEARKGLGID